MKHVVSGAAGAFTVVAAVLLLACGGGGDELEQKCLDSLVPYGMASKTDTAEWMREEAERGDISLAEIESTGDLEFLAAEVVVLASLDSCLVDPQAALDLICYSSPSRINLRLWYEDWCE